MKRKLLTVLLTLIAALCLCFGLVACDNGNSGNTGNSGSDTEQEETKKPDEGTEPHVHDFTDYVSNNDATCTEDGTETGKCSCGVTDTRTVEGSKLGHTFETYVSNEDATCTEDGTETAKCVRCTETDTRTVEGSKLGHTFETYVSNEDATCTEDGTETARCVRCTETDTRTVKGTKLGHDTELHTGTATCTEAGTLDYWRCWRCNKDFIDEEGTAEIEKYETDVPLGHRFTAENKCVYYDTCKTEWKFTGGLTYSLNADKKSYTVTGKGTASGDIVIPYGYQGKFVTSIGENAFYYFSDMTSITISDSVTSIGDSAFYDCWVLKSITIPDSVTSIGTAAFYRCRGLTGELKIPDSVTSIGNAAFAECDGLTGIEIPDSVISIGYHAFYETAYYKDASHWDSSGVLYIGNHLIEAPKTISGTYNIRTGTKTIAGEAFQGCHELTGVTIPDSVTSIAEYAFSGCDGLTSIEIPDSVTTIGHWAFNGCEGLTAVHIKSLEAWCKIEFYDYTSNPLYYAGHLYLDGEKITVLTIDDAITEIKAYAFYGYSKLTGVTIGSGVTSIGNSAFWGCSGLTSVTIGSGVISIGDEAFCKCSGLTGALIIPDSVESIGYAAFSDCKGLTSVEFPDSVISIGGRAFYDCSKLASITIPDSVTSIGYYAFNGTAYSIGSSHRDDSGVLYIGNHLIEAPNSISGAYSIRTGTKTIADGAFIYCEELTSITIPDSVTSIGEYVFGGCIGLEHITVAKGNPFYRSEQECLIEIETKKLIAGCKNSVIPDGVTSIGYMAFEDCSGLTSIIIPDSVTSIEEGAFYGCSELTDIQFKGTVKEWQDIEKENNWDAYTGDYTVTCTDGTIDKSGNVVYFEQ